LEKTTSKHYSLQAREHRKIEKMLCCLSEGIIREVLKYKKNSVDFFHSKTMVKQRNPYPLWLPCHSLKIACIFCHVDKFWRNKQLFT